jgi:hypothetical protein
LAFEVTLAGDAASVMAQWGARPTDAATRLTGPERTSPMAKTPGLIESRANVQMM